MNQQLETTLFFVAIAWSFLIKGVSLWRAAKQQQRNWFIAMLVISSFGILELIYLFRFSTKRLSLNEIKTWNPFK